VRGCRLVLLDFECGQALQYSLEIPPLFHDCALISIKLNDLALAMKINIVFVP
jgi:hypothetical protein